MLENNHRRRMKWRILLLPLLFAILLFSCAMPVPAASGENDGDVLTVGIPADHCPIFYHNPDTGESVGIGVDLMRFAAEKAGYAIH